MNEKDWKHLSALRETAVERLYDRIFENLKAAVQANEKTGREKVFDAKEAIDAGLKEVRYTFDSLPHSRSNANIILLAMVNAELVTEQEMAGFSEGVQQHISSIFNDPL
ncbi:MULTISPECIES: hypothetical protein [Pseudomonas syringae group]|uniref:Uncharacterized protein n=2 Tax=Pseudomonas syringae group TaxID=136849 RepID=A0ABX6H9F2_9PSED|nr:hypothetical protein [Pseudomonas asturiensis]QHF02147.1 hypothetical protein N015_06865 [Pseudomonas asturiensis]